MFDDLKSAFRVWFKYPVHSLVVVLTLAIGIGATTTVYTFSQHLWTPAPDFREIHRLLAIYGTGAGREGGGGQSSGGISPADFRDWQMEVGGFEPLAAWTGWLADLSGEAAPERLSACLVTANFFATLGVRPAWGTFFSNGADEPGAEPEVMLSHGLWQRRFGGDTNIVGRSIQLTGTGHRVVGVLPERARYPQGAELWVPLKLGVEEWAERDRAYLRVLGRLKPGVTAGQAAAELRTVSERLAREYRQPGGIRAVQVRSVREELMFGQLAAAGFAGGVAMFVLLLVCANVASLQLALGLARRQEFAVRAALGADCRRLVRQLLTESCLLALVGGGLGILFAVWGIPLARARLAAEQLASVAGLDAVRLSLSGLGFTVGISLLAGMLTGLMPALATATADVMSTLKEGCRQATGDRRRQRLRRGLVVSEIVLALAMLTGACIFLHAFLLGLRFEPGMELEGTLALQIMPAGPRYATPEQVRGLKQQAMSELAAIPGVTQLAVADGLPLGPNRRQWVETDDGGRSEGEWLPVTGHGVGADYFQVLRIPIRQGRGIELADGPASLRVAVVSESLARRAFGGLDAIGRRLRVVTANHQGPWLTVVGVVGDVKRDPWGSEPKAFYVALEQEPPLAYAFLLRTTLKPDTLISEVRRRMQGLDAQLPLLGLEPLEESVRRGLGVVPLLAPLLGGLGVLALGLCAVGIYGVMAYNVWAREPEIGIRLALGATRPAVFRLIMGGGLGLAAWGLGIGFPVAVGLSWVLVNQAFELAAGVRFQFLVLGGVLLAIAIISLAACWLPARRAMRIDPMTALRRE
jgi:putative ABC transport system permease protein